MRTKKTLSSEELNEEISKLVERRALMEKRVEELAIALHTIDKQLKGLYAKRTIALNFTLPLEDATK
jgi:hypothetical protein